ncbi:glucose-6-phosphate isomerase [Mesomycoplasma hyopneumoniae]|uniref:glucose-6-phosphate isomerase n=1 Tax=Mesomycoplasma hyopneumoniae TaxID=2099 RepID=UPI00108332FE|nr:glucose-6-phosphate isomerase [Mesomycoplasma hyopneumoniae]MXR33552.1 glucose-6-phosphate isomerase [Mesomycoplasma hyopneumoniae]MXR35011.1 glucose-6-phosphate isomerase [Mesomycoplasma hyopneumoniae]MXR57176.1 glucose-6-phosphate isomerase [Mesomycoplasma hyopneumoniae]QBY87830.1 glucose-6-phosphate isomerase [Mesomycoplasma hyopneumoniae]QEA02742.1 glucose-6-phosphate isomerase [Mesomycoplasma hyopneumoniae]
MSLKLEVKTEIKLDYQGFQNQINEFHKRINDKNSPDINFLGWNNFPEVAINPQEIARMRKIVENLHQNSINVLVVIGIGGSYLGAKAALDFILGLGPFENKPEVIFLGNSLSSTDLYQKIEYLKTKNFAINVISKSGSTIEPAITFQILYQFLIDQIGEKLAKTRTFVTTSIKSGELLEIAKSNELEIFEVIESIGGRFSVLSSVGFFPLLFAKINVDEIIQGAIEAHKKYSTSSISQNLAYKYALFRFLMYKNFNYKTEILISYEPFLIYFNEWWKQLFGESEGKNLKGLFPASAIFTTDLHSLGQFIQDGSKNFFQTIIYIKKPKFDLGIKKLVQFNTKINKLSGKTVSEINFQAFLATTLAHSSYGNNPNLVLEIADSSPKTFGHLVMFFEKACAMSAYLLGVNPFDQPGVESYKNELAKNLGWDR